MNFMRLALIMGCMTLITLYSTAQYWIGPKFGYHYTIHDYQDDNYLDDYRSLNNHNFEAGVVVTYTASERYAVHGELYYEQIGNRIKNRSNFEVDSETRNNYLSFPILLRVSMGKSPVHWYVNGGPKVSFWMSGRGNLAYADDEGGPDGFTRHEYKVVWRRSKAGEGGDPPYHVYEANRLQYALTAGGGFYLDLANGARVMVDFRYNWGHSNMGFNRDYNEPEGTLTINPPNIPLSGYQENYEYTHNTVSVSIAYMFEYNTQLKRKGGSTSGESKKTKKSAKSKKKSSQ